MAEYHVVLFNFAGNFVPQKKIEAVFASLKDWMKFSSQAWVVYTNVRPSDLRDRLSSALSDEDPMILILSTNVDGWSAYAKPLPRDWLKASRDDQRKGE